MLLSGGVPGATLHRKLAPERLTSRDASDNSIASDVVCLNNRKVNKFRNCLKIRGARWKFLTNKLICF